MVVCDPSEPLPPSVAKGIIRKCLITDGAVAFSKHARQKMVNDDLVEPDIVNTLRCGRIDSPAELVNFHWRYRVSTDRIAVVVTFEPEEGEIEELVIITAWRFRRRGV